MVFNFHEIWWTVFSFWYKPLTKNFCKEFFQLPNIVIILPIQTADVAALDLRVLSLFPCRGRCIFPNWLYAWLIFLTPKRRQPQPLETTLMWCQISLNRLTRLGCGFSSGVRPIAEDRLAYDDWQEGFFGFGGLLYGFTLRRVWHFRVG